MARSRIQSSRLVGGLGRRLPNLDGVCGFIMSGVAVVGGIQLNTVYELNAPSDLETLLVDANYDTTNKVLVYHHIERFFGRNRNGKAYLMLVAQTSTLTNMVDITVANSAKKMLAEKQGEIKFLVVARNPVTGYTPTLEDGLDADVFAAIPKAQELIDSEAQSYRLLDAVIIEGRSFNGTASAAENLRSLGAYEGVSVVIAADNDVSSAMAEYNGYAAVGDFAGLLSAAAISQHPGEPIEQFNLVNEARGWFVNPGLSSNQKITAYTDTDLGTLDTKGFIYAESIPLVQGIFFQDTHTLISIDSDYAFIENNRVINKMIRLANSALSRKAKARYEVDSETGQIDPAVATGLEGIVVEAVSVMETDGDLSGDSTDAYLDVSKDILSGESIDIELTAIPIVIGREITLKVGFSNPFRR